MCAELLPMTCRTRLLLVIHFAELRRTSNTGNLAYAALENSERVIRGVDRTGLDLREHLTDGYQPVFLYPADGAVELTPDVACGFDRPVQLIVPDGNWRQASKVHYRHQEVSDVPRVFVRGDTDPKLRVRQETTELGMATLEAIAFAFGVLESPEVEAHLMRLYRSKAERILWSRGHLSTADCREFQPGMSAGGNDLG
jgi:DTW domain-containing protein YfiP